MKNISKIWHILFAFCVASSIHLNAQDEGGYNYAIYSELTSLIRANGGFNLTFEKRTTNRIKHALGLDYIFYNSAGHIDIEASRPSWSINYKFAYEIASSKRVSFYIGLYAKHGFFRLIHADKDFDNPIRLLPWAEYEEIPFEKRFNKITTLGFVEISNRAHKRFYYSLQLAAGYAFGYNVNIKPRPEYEGVEPKSSFSLDLVIGDEDFASNHGYPKNKWGDDGFSAFAPQLNFALGWRF